jgi:hypothetical protein
MAKGKWKGPGVLRVPGKENIQIGGEVDSTVFGDPNRYNQLIEIGKIDGKPTKVTKNVTPPKTEPENTETETEIDGKDEGGETDDKKKGFLGLGGGNKK